MKIEIKIKPKDIADLMCTAVEGNHMTRSWCEGLYPHGVKSNAKAEKLQHWYADEAFYSDERFSIKVNVIDDERDNKITEYIVRAADFREAFALMAENYGRHFGDFLAENYDIYTADVFLQLVVLKDVLYG